MDIGFIVLITIAALAFLFHFVIFILWLNGKITMANFFKSVKSSLLFFIPIVGFLALIIMAIKARLREDFTKEE